ncbi:pHD finger protein ALFIN-LIKE 2 isoform 2 [Oryza sativa Japonica Group]|jgi:hypothetical protein|uniref:pHD finger protein ALFIN-LIKE 2 isoform 2 n=1 Tax=Oryza sativa subsp. japonica TaxID=39947 RepID=UPI001F58CA52|nr:pHD finger protein ALFIN-LIKE 2 isoform 2 [Oryza sativa Japonica Group]
MPHKCFLSLCTNSILFVALLHGYLVSIFLSILPRANLLKHKTCAMCIGVLDSYSDLNIPLHQPLSLLRTQSIISWLTKSFSWIQCVALLIVRKRLFSLINDHPTVLEALSDRKHGRDNKSGADNGSKSRHSGKRANDVQTKTSRPAVVDDGYDEEEHSETLCGTCGGRYNANEFWIGCDICERWFHGKCVRITPAKAEHIKHYKCPDCSSSKKSRQ